jgi:hypothetical protein
MIALFRMPPSKPGVPISRHRAFQHHQGDSVRERDRLVRSGRPACSSWWQVRQRTSVLRRRATIILTQLGFSRPSYLLRSLRARIWWTCIVSVTRVAPQCSQIWAKSRLSRSDRSFHDGRCRWSSTGAFTFHFKGMAPQVATSGFFPSRSTVVCKTLYCLPSTFAWVLYRL